MPERLTITPESHEARSSIERHEALPTAAQAEKLRPEKDPLLELQKARASVEQHVDSDNPLQRLEAAEKAQQAPQPTHVNRELKAITLRRELQHIRRKLPATQRALSQVIHQPAVRAVSEVTGKSLSRPSGLLGGSLVALIGSSGYLYLAKHIGFSYNYFVFILLFIVGFGVGLLLELAVWTLTARHQRLGD